jgi:hypothetical protein
MEPLYYRESNLCQEQIKVITTLTELASEVITLPDTDYPLKMCEDRLAKLEQQVTESIKEFTATL